MNIQNLRELMGKAKTVAHHLTNCTDEPAEAPYLTEEPRHMAARHEAHKQKTGDGPDWDDFGIRLNIADDCSFCTVHGFEGEAQECGKSREELFRKIDAIDGHNK